MSVGRYPQDFLRVFTARTFEGSLEEKVFGLGGRDATELQTYRDGCAERVVLITDVTAVGSVCVVVARGDGVWGQREGGGISWYNKAECKSCDVNPPCHSRAVRQLIITLCVCVCPSGSTCHMTTTRSVERQA